MKISPSKNVIVTDPSYDTNTWCQAKFDNVLEGVYNTNCAVVDTGDWGNRCSYLIAVHENYNIKDLKWEIDPAEIGVDSGQAGIFDMKFYKNDKVKMNVPSIGFDGNTFDRLEQIIKPEKEGEQWYLNICKITLSKDMWGGYKYGAACRSGYGDGGYSLYVSKEKGKVVAFCIDFQVEDIKILNKSL